MIKRVLQETYGANEENNSVGTSQVWERCWSGIKLKDKQIAF